MICHLYALFCGFCLQSIAGCGAFAWLITLTVFVFREQGKACNFQDGPTTVIEQAWADEWKFNERVALATWGTMAGICVLGTCIGICSCVCGISYAIMEGAKEELARE